MYPILSPAVDSAKPSFERIPSTLTALPQWLCWCREDRDGKPSKVPYSARSGKRGKSNDPATWSDFTTACSTYHTGGYSGIGFAFRSGDRLTGLDIDHVIDENTGGVNSQALEILARFKGTYCEKSPSGTGLRIFCYGRPGRTGKNEGKAKWLEVYDHTSPRYLTVTGNHWEGCATEVTEQQAALDWLHTTYFKKLGDDDQTLINKAMTANNGDDFRALWKGDKAAYANDDSQADLALCLRLAYWTGKDADRIDRLFRQSGLMRPKWDERRGDTTYGATTISKAIAFCKKVNTGGEGEEFKGEWHLSKSGSKLPVLHNIMVALGLPEWSGVFGRNEFDGKLYLRKKPPYIGEWHGVSCITDDDTAEVTAYLQEWYRLHVTSAQAHEAIGLIAKRNPFHPVRDYLNSLIWDKKPRLDTWLIRYLGAEDNAYVRAVSSKTPGL